MNEFLLRISEGTSPVTFIIMWILTLVFANSFGYAHCKHNRQDRKDRERRDYLRK